MVDSTSLSETFGTERRTLAAVGVLAVVALVAVGGIAALGVGPFASDAGGPPQPGQQAGGGGEPPSEDHVRPFSIDIRKIEQCGNTCRDVTVSITNNGGNARENVTVTTNIYTGNDSVWHGEEAAGTLASDETLTRTKRIQVGVVGGAKIKRNDGKILIETVVRWDGGSATFSERRDVA